MSKLTITIVEDKYRILVHNMNSTLQVYRKPRLTTRKGEEVMTQGGWDTEAYFQDTNRGIALCINRACELHLMETVVECSLAEYPSIINGILEGYVAKVVSQLNVKEIM